jgi:glucose/arabinose dehydrogenase
MRRLAIAGTLALLLSLPALPAQSASAAEPALKLTQVDDTEGVIAMTARPGSRTLHLAEQRGVVWALRGKERGARPVIDLTDRVNQDGGERGLLGLTFSPDGAQLYVHYSDTEGNTQVDRYTMRAGRADPSTRASILQVEQPQPNHNGGELVFGPDGYLYLGLGDGGGGGDSGDGHAEGGNGQSLETLLGKILRIDPSGASGYTVPADNPFVGDADAKPEIWSYGLRNPWRFSFDRETGDLWIGDVGQNAYEEIDRVLATAGRDAGKGVNFGWNRLEGDHSYRGSAPEDAAPPVYEISHDTGACAVVGGYVYRGTKIPGLVGHYLFSDNCDGTIRLLVADGNGFAMRESGLAADGVASFGQANDGTLYVASMTDGVFRVDRA